MNSHRWIAMRLDEFLWFNDENKEWITHSPPLQTPIMTAYTQSGYYIKDNIVFIPSENMQVKISEEHIRAIQNIKSDQCEEVIEMLNKLPEYQTILLRKRSAFNDDYYTRVHNMGGKIKSQYQNGYFNELSALSLIQECKLFNKPIGTNKFVIFNKIN